MRDIVQSTADFESWLRTQISLRDDHLQAKHDMMSEQLFEFFRATFYRWCERWNDACTEWARAEPVVAVGDLHIQNFGSWRDGRGRLIWGASGQTNGEIQMEKLLRPEARPFSPGTMIRNGWLIRPLMSDCGTIDLSLLNVDADQTSVNLDQDRLLTAMGFEIANLHLLSASADRLKKAITEFRVPTFRKTTETMIDFIRTDYKTWRKHWRDARGRSAVPASPKRVG